MTGHGTHRSSLSGRFSHDPDLDFEIRTVLGGAFSGAADAGEVLAAVADVGTDHRAWFRAWDALGDRLAATGESCAARGHRVSAASAYLRAATYLGVAVNAVSGLEDDAPLLPTFRKHRAAWDRWVDLVDLDVERLPIPYEGTTLPGYLFRAPGVDPGVRGPVVVAVNGSDGSLPSLWSAVVSGAVRRGYHALVFDGPGQQSVLFEHGVPFRPDFEAVLTPVLDAVVARADVDPGRVAVYGISQGGYWVTRALAFEHRPAAAVVDPGVVDVATSWEREVPKSLLKLLDKGDDHAFDRDMALGLRLSKGAARTWRFRARPYGEQGYAATLREVRRYDASDVAAQVTTPLLVTSPEDEQFWPGQPERLAGLVPGATLVTFSDDEGASGHCEPLGRALVEQRVLDWLDERLAR
ncbi:alpha/beta hydrolase family protein [Cellulosimicrobium funkei]